MPFSLPAKWREREDYRRTFGDPRAPDCGSLAASELEAALSAHRDETLTLVEAAMESGFTADHLGQLVKRGRIPNAGRDGAPRIRRRDLPVKRAGGAGTTISPPADPGPQGGAGAVPTDRSVS